MTATTTLNNVAHAQDVTPTVMLMQHPTYGLIMTDSSGYTLYTWEADEPWLSNCYDACADAWPPLIASSDLMAPPGLPGSLDMIDRGDGTWQIALDGWPLYYFVRDMSPGDVNGDGSMGFGARWDVVALSPAPIAVEPVPAPPVADIPVPVAPVAQPPAPPAAPPVAAVPAQPATPDMPPMAMPPDMMNPMGLPPALPFPGQATIPPGYLPTLNAVIPPSGTISLNWLPIPGAQQYRIYQTLGSQPLNFTVAQTITQTPGQLVTNAVIGSLMPGQTYLFQVRATDPNGNEIAAPASILGPANAGLPFPGGPGGPSNLTVTSTTPTTITLTWAPVPGARSYIVLQATNPNGPFIPATMSQVTPSGTTISGLSPNTNYFFQLLSIDAFGTQTPASGTVSLTTAPLTATSAAGVVVTNVTSSSANLTWAMVPGAATYQVLQSLSPNGPWAPAAVVNGTMSGGTVNALLPGTNYFFELIAFDIMGNQLGAILPATASTATNAGPALSTSLPSPTGVMTSSMTGSTVTLSWTPTTGATNYAILQSSNVGGPFVPASVSTMSGTTGTISGLNPNTTYYFQVVALDQFGRQSAPSSALMAQTSSSIATTR